MKSFFLRPRFSIYVGAIALLVVSCARAGYNPAIVSADARWVLFADFNVLRSSQLGQELVAALEKAQEQGTRGVIGIDIPKLLATIGTLTAYGSNLTPQPEAIDGTLIAQGTNDLRKIAESFLLQGTLAEPKVFSEVGGYAYPVYAVASQPSPEESSAKMEVFIAFPPEPIVLVSKSKAQLEKAREVFRGQAPSLAKTKGTTMHQLAAATDGAYLFAASMVPAEPLFPEHAPQARILQLTKSASFAIGERGPDTFAHAQLFASSEANAVKIAKILEGMAAVLSLAESNDRQLAQFLNSTKVARNDDAVSLSLAYPTARLVEMTKNLRAEMEPRPSRRPATITMGTPVAEWTTADDVEEADGRASYTVKNVALHNGAYITLGRALNGGKNARFESVEITPASGGAPLTFRRDFMRPIRDTMRQFPFPGADGTYTIKVVYVDDPEGKATFAVSVRDPHAPENRQQ